MVIALAGRRIDANGSTTIRFPLNKIDEVRKKLKEQFDSLQPKALVCSGACGADLLALEVAGSMHISRSMVLPFKPEIFKATSVTDRPGEWGSLFDRICKEIEQEDQLVVMDYPKDDDKTYLQTNFDILDRAEALADKYGPVKKIAAIIVWEGTAKDKNDTTEHFRSEAEKRNAEIKQVITK